MKIERVASYVIVCNYKIRAQSIPLKKYRMI